MNMLKLVGTDGPSAGVPGLGNAMTLRSMMVGTLTVLAVMAGLTQVGAAAGDGETVDDGVVCALDHVVGVVRRVVGNADVAAEDGLVGRPVPVSSIGLGPCEPAVKVHSGAEGDGRIAIGPRGRGVDAPCHPYLATAVHCALVDPTARPEQATCNGGSSIGSPASFQAALAIGAVTSASMCLRSVASRRRNLRRAGTL